MSNQPQTTEAWLGHINGQAVAVGANRLRMLIDEPQLVSVMAASEHCNQLLLLKNKQFPVLNTDFYFAGIAENPVAGLMAYIQADTNNVELCAVQFDSIPEKVTVSNEMEASIDELSDRLTPLSISAFNYNSALVAVLDIEKLINHPREGVKNEI